MASQIWEGPLKTSGASCEFYLLPKPLCWSMFYGVQLRRMIWSRRDEPYGLTPGTEPHTQNCVQSNCQDSRAFRAAWCHPEAGRSREHSTSIALGVGSSVCCAHCPPPARLLPATRPFYEFLPRSGVVGDEVDLGLFFRQFKVEVPRAHWSGGRAAGMCGCVEPTSGILVSGGRRAHQFPFSWRHIHHALPNNSSKDRQSFSDGHSLRCVQLPGPLTMPGRETACVLKTPILGCRPTAPQPYRVPIASRRGINQVRPKTCRKPA